MGFRAAILPINKWKDGVGKAINFSYFSPYDVVRQPVTALLKTIEEKEFKTTRRRSVCI